MADALGTTGTVLSTAAPLLNAVPYVGPILSAAATIGGGIMQTSAAKKQAAQAAKVRDEALRTGKQPLRPEFAQRLRMDKMLAQAGLAGLPLYQEKLDERLSNSVRSVREQSNSGAGTLAAVSALTGAENDQLRELMIQDAAVKQELQKRVGDTNWDIGVKERGLEDIRDAQKREGLTAAAALENAATYNKQQGIKSILGAVGTAATGLTANAQPALPIETKTGKMDIQDNQATPDATQSKVLLPPTEIGGELSPEQAAQLTQEMNALLMKGNLTADELTKVKQYRELLKGYSTQ